MIVLNGWMKFNYPAMVQSKVAEFKCKNGLVMKIRMPLLEYRRLKPNTKPSKMRMCNLT